VVFGFDLQIICFFGDVINLYAGGVNALLGNPSQRFLLVLLELDLVLFQLPSVIQDGIKGYNK